KLCILNVAQEGYKISIATTISKILVAILQALLLIKYSSFYIYILIQIVINLIYYILMNLYIDKKYNWLKNIKGKISLEEKDSLIKNVKALFLHKIGSIVVFGTDNLVISAFINLCAVSKVNSYNMIISAVQGIIGNSMNAITPSIGNLLVEDNKKLAYTVHKRIFFLNFWVVSFIIISLFNTITQFVKLWLGDTQILSEFTISIILVNTYFQLMRSSVERFKDGSGNYYQDRYAAFFEAIINLIV
ncbi:O-unit flippase, partial [Clostridium perfringens]